MFFFINSPKNPQDHICLFAAGIAPVTLGGALFSAQPLRCFLMAKDYSLTSGRLLPSSYIPRPYERELRSRKHSCPIAFAGTESGLNRHNLRPLKS